MEFQDSSYSSDSHDSIAGESHDDEDYNEPFEADYETDDDEDYDQYWDEFGDPRH